MPSRRQWYERKAKRLCIQCGEEPAARGKASGAGCLAALRAKRRTKRDADTTKCPNCQRGRRDVDGRCKTCARADEAYRHGYERAERFRTRFAAGETLEQIGRDAGLTKAGVHYLIRRYFG